MKTVLINWLLRMIGFEQEYAEPTFCAEIPFEQFSVSGDYYNNPKFNIVIKDHLLTELKLRMMDGLIESGAVQIIEQDDPLNRKINVKLTIFAGVGEPS